MLLRKEVVVSNILNVPYYPVIPIKRPGHLCKSFVVISFRLSNDTSSDELEFTLECEVPELPLPASKLDSGVSLYDRH